MFFATSYSNIAFFALLAIAVLVGGLVVLREAAPRVASASQTTSIGLQTVLRGIRSWGYQLQSLDIAHAASSPFDLLVIDPSRDGADASQFSATEIARLKHKPDGQRRLVLAYLSIGEAESYRDYWQRSWLTSPPSWLLGENRDWPGNYAVCFWRPEWQALMFGRSDARLDRILAAGFDGVYLDKCDVIDDLTGHRAISAAQGQDLPRAMINFIGDLSTYAKRLRPGFLVIMQNAENLLEDAHLRAHLDGIAKEDLLFGVDGPQRPNVDRDIADSRALLSRFTAEGKIALTVEYLDDAKKIAHASFEAKHHGFILHISAKSRRLDRLDYDRFEA